MADINPFKQWALPPPPPPPPRRIRHLTSTKFMPPPHIRWWSTPPICSTYSPSSAYCLSSSISRRNPPASPGLLGDVNVSPSADGSSTSSSVLYEPLLLLNLYPQLPLLREPFHFLPLAGEVYSLDGGLLTNNVDERELNVGLYQNVIGRVYEFNVVEIGGKNRDKI